MGAPIRIQLKREKGWRMPENTVKVDRSTQWGNPWRVGDCFGQDGDGKRIASAADCVELFRLYATDPDEPFDTEELRGKNLACWCAPDQPCHADVLLMLANHPTTRPGEG